MDRYGKVQHTGRIADEKMKKDVQRERIEEELLKRVEK